VHELGLVQELVAVVSERFKDDEVTKVVVEVGALAAVLPDALTFAFEACREGAGLARATLEVRRVPGVARCRACAAPLELDGPLGACACGSTDLEWLDGQSLRLLAVEVAT
jgi:hydrogenase nickel incorporation protein HypA/HybF